MFLPPIVGRTLLIGVASLLTLASVSFAVSQPNVLFIAVDDLRPELACYGSKHISSPHIDRFAATALRFERAYCQQAVCNPSRTSLMTGLRPDTIGVTGNHSHFRANMPDVITLPQHFKNHGYHTAAIGKVYHGVFPDGASITKWDTMGDPQSWSVSAIRFGPRYYYTEEGIIAAKATYKRVYRPKNPRSDDWTKKLVFGPATEAPEVADNVLYDGQVADAAIGALRERKQNPEQPFFIAVGFIKPHSPFIAPKKYFDLYENVGIARDQALPTDAPSFAGHNSGELRRYTDQPARGTIPIDNQRRVRQAYYACVSYIDAQIGRVLDELDRLGLAENTIVSLYGDHGYHLGEQGLWGKTTNYELDTRVPLIIRAPGMEAAGKSSGSLVELVDLYPTLADLAGLPIGQHLEGKSLAALLDDPAKSVKEVARSQYPRGGGLMGYSMRTPTHRLTQWVHRASGQVRATELYEYSDDSEEAKNIAADSPDLVRTLASQFTKVTPASFAPAGSSVAKKRIKVACVGDSITYGLGIADRTMNSYPALLQQMLGDDYEVGNFGYSGATLLKKGHKPYWQKAPYGQSLEFQPDLVVINLGANDAVDSNWKHAAEFKQDYEALIATYRSLPSKPKVTICEILPMFPNHGRFRECNANRKQMTLMIRDVAESAETGMIDLHKPFLNQNGMFPDGLHPNEDGALLMAQHVFTALTGRQPPTVTVRRSEPFHADRGTSFETVKSGPFKTLKTSVGVWTTTSGTAQIATMGASGRQSLQLAGGNKTTIELAIAGNMKTDGKLTFRAERWTSRKPFSFRVEKFSGGKWLEIYNGDRSILVGRPFKSNVLIPLNDDQITGLRFSVTSPANTGAMIDDLQFVSDTNDTAATSATGSGKSGQTSFEAAGPGSFQTLKTEIGTWTPSSGKAVVDNKHAKTGNQCLHLPGDNSVIELEVANGIGTDGQLTFAAERWTSRAPFSFRIEKLSGGKWTEIFNGDKQVRVGRSFLSSVKVPLGDSGIKRLRFRVTSPANTGVLIDDIRIAPALPQKIVSARVVPMTLPALVGAKASPLLKLKIETVGSLQPISLETLAATLEGTTDVADIDSLQLFNSGENASFAIGNSVGYDKKIEGQNDRLSFSCPPSFCLLSEGTNYVWIACTLKPSANIDNRVGAVCKSITFSSGETIQVNSPPSIQQMGVSVRTGGDEGVHTYRIPGLATTKKGSLIAVYDVRRRSGGDLPGDIDVGMSRSTDGGRTWEPMRVIMDMGNDPKWNYDGIGDPAVLVDKNTGTIWVAATWSHGNRSWRGSGPGLKPEETGQWMLVRSDDDGVTWSKPINITKQVKKPEWCFVLQGPGKGITMRDGTIAFAAQYQDPPEKRRLPHSAFIYSRDHGKTWDISTGAYDNTTEAQIIELADGQIMINCRYNRASRRVVMTTDDMGKTWQEHLTSRKSLVEPGACMASLINVGRELSLLGIKPGPTVSNELLLFSNPDSTRGRNHITIKASLDGGATWPSKHHLLLDEQGGAGYSCMTMIDAETVGIIYEGSQAHMTFQRVKLADILHPPANQKTKNPAQVQFAEAADSASAATTRSKSPFALARAFGDHMVLQAEQPIRIWGRAKAGAKVEVVLAKDRGAKVVPTIAGPDGRWIVELRSRSHSSEPHVLAARSEGKTETVHDVLIGEVWLCAGQSNMEWPLASSTGGREAIQNSGDFQLRLMNFAGAARGGSGVYNETLLSRLDPDRFSTGAWKVSGPKSSAIFSAVGYYFAQQLRKKLDCPVGMINVSIGGTPIEAWIDAEALSKHAVLSKLLHGNWLDNPLLDEWCRTRARSNLRRGLSGELDMLGDQYGPNHSFKPGFMHDAGIEPFVPMSLRGVLWYQGESNGDNLARTQLYDACFRLLVDGWRSAFQNENMPVCFVQLPAMGRPNWPVFREFQRRSLEELTNVGMAITIDTGHPTNVHPPDKQPIGTRLAHWALVNTYGIRGPPMGPLYQSSSTRDGTLVVSFRHAGDLKTSNGEPPNHFEIAGADGVFHRANATIDHQQVVVSSEQVQAPKVARYAWAAFPKPFPNLVNGAGLPASPFTTDLTFPAGESSSQARRGPSAIPTNIAAPTSDAPASEVLNSGRPNILFIVSEDNSDHLGCYGEQRVHTPHLDALAEGGVRYTRAYVPYSVCSPSRAAFLTGLYTRQTGHIGLATHRFSMYRDFKTMPAYFQQAGYYTGFLGKTHINPERLVEDYVDHRAIRNSNFGKTISIETYAKEASTVMKNAAERKKPFLLIINYADAHRSFVRKSKHGFPTRQVDDEIAPFPWIGSDTPHLREELRDYFNCMNRLDEGVGMVLDKLDEAGARDNTLVIYISDHGADFPRGKGSIYENGTRIPMIINYPKSFPTRKVENGMVSTIDILPTMLRAARLRVPEHLPGIALQDIDSGKVSPRKYIHTFTTGSSPNLLYMQFGIRDQHYKLVYNPDRALNRLAESRYRNSQLPKDQHVQSFLHPPEYELFDLQEDPHEWKNLADSAEHEPIRQRLLMAMHDFQREIKDPFASHENIATFIAEQKEYQSKPYKKRGFRWPHLDMFEKAHQTPDTAPARQTIFGQRAIPDGVPREGHAKGAKLYGYRIPSLLVTKKGSILAFSERRLGLHDHAQNDIVLKRSTDGGKTWSDEIVAYEDGMNSINDPLTVQLENGRILLMFARFPYGRHARDAGWIKMADLGYDDPQANVLTFICHSDDDGLTWSKPVDISRQVKHPTLLNANTPGAMIQLTKGPHKGRVVTGLWGTLPTPRDGKRSREWQIVVAYSDDNGQSWKRTEPLEDKSGIGFPNECQVAEAANGDIVLISRNQGGERFRKKAISRDGGATWSPLDIDRTLPSVACMGSVIKGPVKDDGTWDLWASFPSSAGRKDGQIAISKDNGRSWQIVKVIPGPFAYSALQVSPDQKSLLCLYESNGYRTQTLITIPLNELDDVAETFNKSSRPNVVFIMVDDWNDWVGCLVNKQAHTPNVDQLASRGLLFTNAHCVAPVCNPSRVAALTGLRPDTTGVYENNHVMRRKIPDVVTLPQYFRQQGYHVAGGGKVFHDVPPHCHDPASWDTYFWWNEHGSKGGLFGGAWRSPYSIPPDPQLDGRPLHVITKLTKRNFDWGAVDQPESDWPDSKVAAWATEFLSREHTKPFFLAVGIFRPHVPWFNPRKYVEKYPLDTIRLPIVRDNDLDDLGPWAKKRALDRNSQHEQLVEFGEWKPAVQAYLASISFADANVGRVLDALEKSPHRDKTIVVFWSDHGYHLGEKGHWHKRTLWERSTHVPFVIAAPDVTKAETKCGRPVSLLDIYPTLVSLCGLKERPKLEGHDLTPLLKTPQSEWPHAAVTTWNPGNHSVRSERWRYIRYATGEEELYDHDSDPNEWHNLAANATYAETKRQLARHLPASVPSEERQE